MRHHLDERDDWTRAAAAPAGPCAEYASLPRQLSTVRPPSLVGAIRNFVTVRVFLRPNHWLRSPTDDDSRASDLSRRTGPITWRMVL